MTQPAEEVEQDLSHIHWSWPEAIAANPARSLATADLAMDYFAYSPFWDSKSNNNVLRTQRRVENPTYGHVEEKVELNAFKSGFEYIISHSQPPDLFVIQKRQVEPTGKRDRVTGSWFILNEKIYQSPTVYDVVSARLRNASHLISKTLTSLSGSHPSSNPRTTTLWRSLPPEAVTQAEPKPTVVTAPDSIEESIEDEPEKAKKGTQFDWHLFHSLQTTRSSLSSLDESSKRPIDKPDPMTELKSVEAQMSAQFGIQSQTQNQNQNQSQTQGRPGSIRSSSIRGPGLTPGTTAVGISPAPTGMGITPGLPGLAANSPRANSVGGRALSTVGAGSPANLL
ncbi:uncharacterized protein IL334_003406 [Kwoniella shivajii]|uniref:Mediator of RNA polymerase II transcription subunit 6 n=1 Tax=Kwoniella shivajii TaxID=564305 RepID=A0ABZ1CY15_9TREE|nr:hypothetical protein IL334_003406 [Kwoniella shivajii]